MADKNLQSVPLTDDPVDGEIYMIKNNTDYRIKTENLPDPRFIGQQVLSVSTTLASDIKYVIATQRDIIITLFALPLASTTLKIVNDSDGNVVIVGNGKLIYDAASITLYAGEGLHVFFNNNKWNII